jgi:hypothetical protein
MNKAKPWLSLLMTACGIAAIILGAVVFTGDAVKQISGLCFGVGSALAALGLGGLADGWLISRAEGKELMRRKSIEMNDERNIRLRDKVGARLNQVMIYALSAVVLAMGLIRVSLIAILMVASIFLLELVLAVVFTDYYSKRM